MNDVAKFKHTGIYRHYEMCRFCFCEELIPVINLGYMPLAGGFLKYPKDFEKENFYPLEVSFCSNCNLLQSVNVVDADTLFKDYFYHSSAIKTLINHFKEIANELLSTRPSFIVEIGCNDGSLIEELTKLNIKALGVDPAENIVVPLMEKKLPIINDYFTEKLANKLVKKYGKADVICSFNVMAHIENMHDVAKGIKKMLKPNGYLMFEVHYLGNLLNETQYDFMYHEHQYYYSLLTLQKFFVLHDMEIYDVKAIQIHGGSMRYYVQNKKTGKRKISKDVEIYIKKETKIKLNTIAPYLNFSKKIIKTKTDLLKLLKKLKQKNKTIAGYGASGRGTIIMNYCGLDNSHLDYIIDDAPAKQGKYIPGTHLKIVNSDVLKTKQRPDYVVLFAWSFLEEIKAKNEQYLKSGGKFILPLPNVKIIEK